MADVITTSDQTVVLETLEQTVIVDAATQGPPGPQGAPGVAGDGTYQTLTDVALGGHRIVCLIDGNPRYADCTVPAHVGFILGMTTGAASPGANAVVVRTGDIVEPSWAWDTTKPVYLGVNGVPTQTLPPNAAFSLIVGVPKTPTTLFVALREPIALS